MKDRTRRDDRAREGVKMRGGDGESVRDQHEGTKARGYEGTRGGLNAKTLGRKGTKRE